MGEILSKQALRSLVPPFSTPRTSHTFQSPQLGGRRYAQKARHAVRSSGRRPRQLRNSHAEYRLRQRKPSPQYSLGVGCAWWV